MNRLLIIVTFVLCTFTLKAQDSLQVIVAKSRSKVHNVKINFMAFPNYTPSTKLGVALGAITTYTTNKSNPLLFPSTLSFVGNITTTGYYLLGVKGNNISNNNRYIVDYSLNYNSFPNKFWGLGFTPANCNSNSGNFVKKSFSTNGAFLYRVDINNLVGVYNELNSITSTNFSNIELIGDRLLTNNSYGYGAIYIYDSRNFIVNTSSGLYLKAQQRNFISLEGKPFYKTNLQFNYYKPIGESSILALDLFTEFGYGDTPWQMMASLGGTERMRGYYLGRYRDNNIATLQLEYRRKIYKSHSAALWGGIGNVWGVERFSLSHTLPNFGIGYRLKLNNSVTFRVDYGFGSMGQNSLIIGINEAF